MITGLLHPAFSVSDIDKALDFYCDALGFRYLFVLRDETGKPKTFYMEVGENQYLELFLSREQFGAQKRTETETLPYGYHHLTLSVSDLSEAEARLRAFGDCVCRPAETDPETGHRRLWARDPDGNLLEFVEA